MNFLNPLPEIYFAEPLPKGVNPRPAFYKEVFWIFLKNLDNRLKLFKHRLNIEFTTAEVKKSVMKYASIYQYNVHISNLEKLSEISRIGLLDIVYSAFKNIGTEYQWDIDVIEDAYQKSLNEINAPVEYTTNQKINKIRKSKAHLLLTLKAYTLTFNACIKSGNGTTETFKLLETNEGNFSWVKMFKEFGWYDNDRFGLKFLKGDLWLVINLETEKIEELINPKYHTQSQIDSFIKQLKTIK